jgi:hypothetical protein
VLTVVFSETIATPARRRRRLSPKVLLRVGLENLFGLAPRSRAGHDVLPDVNRDPRVWLAREPGTGIRYFKRLA